MQSRSSSRLLACGAVAIFAGLLSTAPAVAADSHRHDTHAAVLQLDHGARWQTESVRVFLQSGQVVLGLACSET